MQTWLYLIIAATAGVLMAVQGALNSALSRIIGVLEGSLAVHLLGLITVAALLFLCGPERDGLGRAAAVPWYLYLGGVLNAAIVYGVMLAIGKSGAGAATTAILAGQLTAALLIDQWGLLGLARHPFTWERGLGLALMAVAARLLLGK
ncbi:MAG: DMT family transporter [Firmicutes bacterium]|nr:DMT family transporter [Bacillota bacterium]